LHSLTVINANTTAKYKGGREREQLVAVVVI
jgi:hypothetical protein